MVTVAPPDFAHTQTAERNRIKKAQVLARWAYDRSLDAATIAAAEDATRRAWVRAAGLPSASDETWEAAVSALAVLEEWARANPDHPKAQRAGVAPERDPEPVDVAPEPDTAPTVPIRPGDLVPADQWPKGWAAVAKLTPLTRSDARCSRCRTAAVTAVPVVGSHSNEWRCAGHPPVAGEWGDALDWTPKDDLAHHPDRPHACFNPRCPRYTLSGRPTLEHASNLLDERAAAAGKNRAPVHIRQAAVAAEQARKDREKELRTR